MTPRRKKLINGDNAATFLPQSKIHVWTRYSLGLTIATKPAANYPVPSSMKIPSRVGFPL
jgi:hypothetical protein